MPATTPSSPGDEPVPAPAPFPAVPVAGGRTSGSGCAALTAAGVAVAVLVALLVLGGVLALRSLPSGTDGPVPAAVRGPGLGLSGTETVGPLEVTYVAGWSEQYPTDSGGYDVYGDFVAQVTNTSGGVVRGGVLDVGVFDGGGQELDRRELRFANLAAGATTGVVAMISHQGLTTTDGTEVRLTYRQDPPLRDMPAGAIDVSGLSVAPGPYSAMLTGTVVSTYPVAAQFVAVAVLFFDERGALVAGSSVTLANVPANGEVPVDVPIYADVDSAWTARSYVNIEPYDLDT
jgi:hypothetical protein